MAKKHLHELLNEDQEPFVLIDYINERRSQLHKPELLHLCRRKPASPVSTALSDAILRRRSTSCFFAKGSPLFEIIPERSPCRQNAPSKAAGFLLEAALRIQKQSKEPKHGNKIGYFGSILKRLVMRKRPRKKGIRGEETPVASFPKDDVLRWESFGKDVNMAADGFIEKGVSEVRFSCSCNSSIWTENMEEKSTDLECSSSCESEEFEGMEFIKERRKNNFPFDDRVEFCPSPFHFAVTPSSPDSGLRTPEFSSPRRSPCRSMTEVTECINVDEELSHQNEEDKEKEQFSPVSVLDPPFDDDYYRQEEEDEEDEVFQNNLVTVQRTKQVLLDKIQRFEMLVKLDPLELEKLLNDEEDDTDTISGTDDENEEQRERVSSMSDGEDNYEELIRDILIRSQTCQRCLKIPRDMKMLVLDLMVEEKELASGNVADLAEKLCKKMESWKDVESNTVDMMVELDYRRDNDDWKSKRVEVDILGADMELAIINLLLDELSTDLIHLSCL